MVSAQDLSGCFVSLNARKRTYYRTLYGMAQRERPLADSDRRDAVGGRRSDAAAVPSGPNAVPAPAVAPRKGRPRAPRNSLSADLIIDQALRLLDERDLDSFSMRALADSLGVGTMALYTYFRGKDELFRAARERLFAEWTPPDTEGTWAEQLRAACLAVYEVFTGRPAVLRLLADATSTDEFADLALMTMERQLALLLTSGLSRADAVSANGILMRFTLGSALRELRACTHPGKDQAMRRRLASLSPEQHPTLAALGPELAERLSGGTEQYAFGLDLILTGLEARVAAP